MTKVKPILFPGPMVRAIFDGRKTTTRRIFNLPKQSNLRGDWEPSTVGGKGVYTSDGKPYSERVCISHSGTGFTIVPPFAIGDLLYVREAWKSALDFDEYSPKQIEAQSLESGYGEPSPWAPIEYQADNSRKWWSGDDWPHEHNTGRLRQGMHMMRWMSRLTLEVTSVKVERLQDISERDAIAEGVPMRAAADIPEDCFYQDFFVPDFKTLWDSLNAKRKDGIYAWDKNPWIAAYTFKPIFKNVDEVVNNTLTIG